MKPVVSKAMPIHMRNAGEISYLWDFYRGKQDIRYKSKAVRENINNKVTINRANEIVTFKTSFILNEPILYVSHGESDDISRRVSKLNEFMRAEDKESKDKEIIDWIHICGVAVRLVLPDPMGEEYGSPFSVYTLDPREAFVIYSASIGHEPVAGVVLQKDEKDNPYVMVYTKNRCFTIKGEEVVEEAHILGEIPLVEYINNAARMGSFEPVISILNNINILESNAVDSVEDFVNGFDVFQNCEIANGDYAQLSIGGKAIMIKTVAPGIEAKVYRVYSELNQSGVQQRVDDFTEAYLTICGMPNRNGGSSTSDTGQAVIYRDGWSEAESRAKDTEKLFKRAERRFLRVALNICNAKSPLNLELKDIEINFARKSLNNLQSRFQCLCEGLANDKIHPEMVYNAFGDIFGDKTLAYQKGIGWYDKQKADEEERLQEELDNARTAALRAGRSGNRSVESQDAETGATV